MGKAMDSREILATNLKSLMNQSGIASQAKLASKTGVSQTQIGNILNQKKGASVDILERLAKGLVCDPWLLLAPVILLEGPEYTDFAPLLFCYVNLTESDQKAVWEMTHQLYEATNGCYSP